jgi:hypothetical protein
LEPFPNKGQIAVVIFCDYPAGQPLSYAGFSVIDIRDDTELAKFYSGNPIEDFEDANYYARSIAERIFSSSSVDTFWSEAGFNKDKVV